MKDKIDISKCIKYREIETTIDDWIDHYNNERYQWQLAKLSPNEYYRYITTRICPLNVLDKWYTLTSNFNTLANNT